jgi:hypothetical protein
MFAYFLPIFFTFFCRVRNTLHENLNDDHLTDQVHMAKDVDNADNCGSDNLEKWLANLQNEFGMTDGEIKALVENFDVTPNPKGNCSARPITVTPEDLGFEPTWKEKGYRGKKNIVAAAKAMARILDDRAHQVAPENRQRQQQQQQQQQRQQQQQQQQQAVGVGAHNHKRPNSHTADQAGPSRGKR